MLVLTDGRSLSGTTGSRIGQIALETADGGPIVSTQDGDPNRVVFSAQLLEVLVDPDELEGRRQGWAYLPPRYTKGVLAKYSKLSRSARARAITR